MLLSVVRCLREHKGTVKALQWFSVSQFYETPNQYDENIKVEPRCAVGLKPIWADPKTLTNSPLPCQPINKGFSFIPMK